MLDLTKIQKELLNHERELEPLLDNSNLGKILKGIYQQYENGIWDATSTAQKIEKAYNEK